MAGVARLLAIVLLVALTPLRGVPDAFPPIDGELAGDAAILPGAPVLHWRVTAEATGGSRRHVSATAQTDGLQLRAEIDVDIATGIGTWTLIDGVAEAKVWLPVLLRRFAGHAAEASGQLRFSGAGGVRGSDVAGVMQAEFSEAVVRNDAEGWRLEGVSGMMAVRFDSADGSLASDSPLKLTVRTITTARFGARHLAMDARLRSTEELAVESARVEIAGGEAWLEPFVLPLHGMEARTTLNLAKVGLQDVAQFFPDLVIEARGRIDGQVRMRWSESAGFEFGAAKIALSPNETAELRLAPRPGLLSSSVGNRIPELVSALRRIEMGQAPLRASSLVVALTPGGDAEGRTAHLHLEGAPVDAGIVAPINLDVNMRGPVGVALRAVTGTKLKFAD